MGRLVELSFLFSVRGVLRVFCGRLCRRRRAIVVSASLLPVVVRHESAAR